MAITSRRFVGRKLLVLLIRVGEAPYLFAVGPTNDFLDRWERRAVSQVGAFRSFIEEKVTLEPFAFALQHGLTNRSLTTQDLKYI